MKILQLFVFAAVMGVFVLAAGGALHAIRASSFIPTARVRITTIRPNTIPSARAIRCTIRCTTGGAGPARGWNE